MRYRQTTDRKCVVKSIRPPGYNAHGCEKPNVYTGNPQYPCELAQLDILMYSPSVGPGVSFDFTMDIVGGKIF